MGAHFLDKNNDTLHADFESALCAARTLALTLTLTLTRTLTVPRQHPAADHRASGRPSDHDDIGVWVSTSDPAARVYALDVARRRA